jgi:hypothetical protein
MKRTQFAVMSFAAFALNVPYGQAQQSPVTSPSPTELETQTLFKALPGRWVRVEGGYVIAIKAIDTDGRLDASYANPRPLPFYTAVATSEGGVLKLFFELRAGGYGGSTYTLNYDAASDRLVGVYDQVVVKQKFNVVFVRAKS